MTAAGSLLFDPRTTMLPAKTTAYPLITLVCFVRRYSFDVSNTQTGMQKVTFSLKEEQLDALEEFQQEHDIGSRSKALRRFIEEYEELQSQCEKLHTQCEQLETDLQRAQSRNQLILEQREEHTELVKYVQEERSAEQRWREAGIGQRLKWRLFGMDTDDD